MFIPFIGELELESVTNEAFLRCAHQTFANHFRDTSALVTVCIKKRITMAKLMTRNPLLLALPEFVQDLSWEIDDNYIGLFLAEHY